LLAKDYNFAIFQTGKIKTFVFMAKFLMIDNIKKRGLNDKI
jgi:hypothetical protein